MNKKKNIIKYISIVVLIIVLGVLVYRSFFKSNYAYVDLIKVYNEFEYKKELEKKFTLVKTERQNILDSIKLQVEIKSRELEKDSKNQKLINEYNYYYNQYYDKQKQFEEDNNAMASQYTEQVWKQINSFMNGYGERNNYLIIIGNAGEGNVLYYKKSIDITEDVMEYLNEKYNDNK